MLTYPIVFERVAASEGLPGHFYAHVPALGLTTHGEGIEGARLAVLDLISLWRAEKQAAGEVVPPSGEFFVAKVQLEKDALQSA